MEKIFFKFKIFLKLKFEIKKYSFNYLINLNPKYRIEKLKKNVI